MNNNNSTKLTPMPMSISTVIPPNTNSKTMPISSYNPNSNTTTMLPTALPSPNLTDSSSSPKADNVNERPANAPTPPVFNSMMMSMMKTKELNITEYSNPVAMKSMKKRCRTIMTPNQSRILRKVLEQTAFPSTEIRENLARILGMKPRTIQIWFQNQRQKSRIGGSGLGDNSASDCDDIDETDSNGNLKSPTESFSSYSPSGSSVNSGSPSFAALTAAALALSSSPSPDSPLNAVTSPETANTGNFEKYNKFHGAVYKSIPGFVPSSGYRGNTATAINNKRMLAAATAVNNSNKSAQSASVQMTRQGQALPQQPQIIPTYPQFQGMTKAGSSSPDVNNVSLDVLAAVVSNFRPNGYNYFMNKNNAAIHNNNNNPNSPRYLPPQSPVANANNFYNLEMLNMNRLAPLRTTTVSPPNLDKFESSSNNTNTNTASTPKLPSLRALAQVASLGVEDKSMGIKLVDGNDSRREPMTPGSAVSTSNSAAPNTRRPW